MTRDEVLDEVIDAVQALGLPGGSRTEVFRTIAALKSKPPEKSPEVEPVMERMQANEWLVQLHDMTKERDALRAGYDRLLAQRDREYVEAQALRAERDSLRAQLATSEQERRTDRMLLDKRENVSAQLESMTMERDALRAEVDRLKWEAAGSPMQGEHAGDPAACAACKDGYPPPPGEPAPR